MPATPKADRLANRAPRGGSISPVDHRWYRGGQWMPMASVEVKPAVLEGPTRQVAWATRLRREELARLSEEIATRRLFLSDRRPVDVAGVRKAIRGDEVARFALMTTRSAAVIDDRMVMA